MIESSEPDDIVIASLEDDRCYAITYTGYSSDGPRVAGDRGSSSAERIVSCITAPPTFQWRAPG